MVRAVSVFTLLVSLAACATPVETSRSYSLHTSPILAGN